ncbi:P2R1A-PPP2R2A-interacting phosphatase regulator 1 [Pseudolycoriella hygida]|uniref:P2R1A-PPP2R2A-interacting phosphatase regulator 1 n=1 Tax=Pseudolycoriella hygida TaxID=35572 RepID=A0A9Q0N8W0_9DIPT|nr:P2R1A-PPP2R2A-interacting phosphatase regulator 1 [Pseudolycoriella hygida]
MTSTSSQSTNSPVARDASPQPAAINLFSRTRRYSASYSGLTGPRLIHRVSQLRQEECADINTREVSHEREVHTALQISQSWESLLLDDADSWSIKSDSELSNPLTNSLHVNLPATGTISSSSPSPTNNRTPIRLPPFGLSPSPTRRTFATRRSMSPIAMRPSSLGPVKRKFELDDNYSNSYSPPPFKKVFTDRSPICRSPSLTCPSPDSVEGRTTPKLYTSKFSTNNSMSSSSLSSSPVAAPSPSMEIQIDLPSIVPSAESTPPSQTTDECCNAVDVQLMSTDDNAKNNVELDV